MHPFLRMAAVATVLVLAVSCAQKSPVQPVASSPMSTTTVASTKNDAERTPFQQSVAKTLAERQTNGLPVPASVSFTYESPSGAPLSAVMQTKLAPGKTITLVARTTIRYENPAQAGRLAWPPIVIDDEMPPDATGSLLPGDYSQVMREKVEESIPGFWQHYEFGQEPRTYHFTETIVYSGSEAPQAAAGGAATPPLTGSGDIVTGFTVPGDSLRYTLEWDFEICDPFDLDICVTAVYFKAGFALDWGLGIRFPLGVSLAGPDPVYEGDTFVPTSTVEGLDWAAQDFIEAGILPEEGNEFALRFEFFIGVLLEVFGIPVIDYNIDVDVNESSSFATPLGPGAPFELPAIDIPLKELGVSEASLSFGFRLTPAAGSDEFNAHWEASADATGSGDLTFSASGETENLASVFAVDGPGTVAVVLDDFEYVFTQFYLDLGIFVALNVFGVVEEDWEIPVTDFDLSAIVPDISMGIHAGSQPTAVGGSAQILNVAPTAEIDRTGTVMINGVPTFLAQAGDELTFSGHATDPGRDDLTLRWDWSDGGPSPDAVTTYPVPYDVTESQKHVFSEACVYAVTFSAEDDDGAVAQDQVFVVITEDVANTARMEGYWQHQLGGQGRTDFDEATLQCYLDVAGHLSTVFNEVRDASTIPNGYDVLFLKKNGGRASEQFDRELLETWLNFANGAFTLGSMVDTDGDGTADTLFGPAVWAAEMVRLNPMATTNEIKFQTQLLHRLNSAATGDGPMAGSFPTAGRPLPGATLSP